MIKPSLQVLAIYELGRLLFFLGLQTNLSGAEVSFGWYIAAPLLFIPFMLIFFAYRAENDCADTNKEDEIQKICLLLFAIQKVASSTGFLLFIAQYVQNIGNNIISESVYFIEKMPFMLIFFAIDVILCLIIVIKQNKKEKSSEG